MTIALSVLAGLYIAATVFFGAMIYLSEYDDGYPPHKLPWYDHAAILLIAVAWPLVLVMDFEGERQ